LDSVAHDLFGIVNFNILDWKGDCIRADRDTSSPNKGGSSDSQNKVYFLYFVSRKGAITVEARPGYSLWLNLPQSVLMQGALGQINPLCTSRKSDHTVKNFIAQNTMKVQL